MTHVDELPTPTKEAKEVEGGGVRSHDQYGAAMVK